MASDHESMGHPRFPNCVRYLFISVTADRLHLPGKPPAARPRTRQDDGSRRCELIDDDGQPMPWRESALSLLFGNVPESTRRGIVKRHRLHGVGITGTVIWGESGKTEEKSGGDPRARHAQAHPRATVECAIAHPPPYRTPVSQKKKGKKTPP